MIGQPGGHTMAMHGGSTASYLANAPRSCLFQLVWKEGAFWSSRGDMGPLPLCGGTLAQSCPVSIKSGSEDHHWEGVAFSAQLGVLRRAPRSPIHIWIRKHQKGAQCKWGQGKKETRDQNSSRRFAAARIVQNLF